MASPLATSVSLPAQQAAEPQPPSTPFPSFSLFYGRTILAPMVRVCSLAFRQLCADAGADVVFTEEVVAAKLCQCRREIRQYPSAATEVSAAETTETVAEYVVYEPFRRAFKRAVVLAVHARAADNARKVPVVLQLGARDPAVAAAAAALCCRDVDAIDVNMGCPKKFSVSNGFGAALMAKPTDAGAILGAIHRRINSEAAVRARGGRVVPVSLKTRLKSREDAAATVTMLAEMAAAAGHTATVPVLHAITLHARVREQRSEEAPLLDMAAAVVKLCRLEPLLANVCLVLNGSVEDRESGHALCAQLGFDGVMIARAALWDPVTVFRTVPLPLAERTETHYMASMKALLMYSLRYRAEFKNVKYHLTRTFPEVACIKARMPVVQDRLRGYEDCFDFFGLTDAERSTARSWMSDVELVDAVPVAGDSDGAQTAKRARAED